MTPRLVTIPTTDVGFRQFVVRTRTRTEPASAADFEARLKRTNPRVVVRERGLTGELPVWYVYRDGAWRHPDGDRWWDDPAAPRVETSADGWVEDVNATARDLLGLEPGETRHFTDFVVPGGLDDALALFEIARTVGELEATVLLQPTTGDVIAVDVRAAVKNGGVSAALRLASDVDVVAPPAPEAAMPRHVEYLPSTDVAFRSYAAKALSHMSEPTAAGLALRLRRLYPHAQVDTNEDGWLVRRDRSSEPASIDPWWLSEQLPRVRYDAMALILEANDAATQFFGRPLVGHHWQEFVTAGTTDEVAAMLAILAEAGAAESRFRMPAGDGSLLEFESYTVIEGDDFSTVYRPVQPDHATAKS